MKVWGRENMSIKNYSFIWDLDGTLIDSYDIIAASLVEVLAKYGKKYETEEIMVYIKQKSVADFLHLISEQLNTNLIVLKSEYSAIRIKKEENIMLIKHAKKVLKWIEDNGMFNFIYTHKGNSTYDILKNLEIDQFFEEVITSNNSFKRKPNPEAILYLISKYKLNVNTTFYIGDRQIDVECAKNAGIKAILLLDNQNNIISSNYKVTDLLEIIDIVKSKQSEQLR